MEIPTYQIHAVLSSLSRRLSRQACKLDARSRTAEDHRLQGVIERVSRSIIERITQAGVSQEKNGCQEHLQTRGSGGQAPPHFQFSVLDESGHRQPRTIPIEAASLLLETDSSKKHKGVVG